MDDFISLSHSKPDVDEFDVLKLTADEPQQPSTPVQPPKTSITTVKPFYPTCKRVLTRAPFNKKQTNSSSSSAKPQGDAKKTEDVVKTEDEKKTVQDEKKDEETNKSEEVKKIATLPKKTTIGQISLEQLMSVDDVESPEKKRPVVEKDARLRNMLKQAELEKITLQGYVATLQAKLAAVPKKQAVKCSETQTSDIGVKCPTCSSQVEPHVLLKSFGDDFTFDTEHNRFVQKSSGFFYDPSTQLYECEDNSINYYWDAAHNIFHYHSNTGAGAADVSSNEASEEEGELTDEQTSDLTEAANTAMKASGVKFISSMNMYYNKNTGLYYCQSSGLYYDTKMSVFYTLLDGDYVYHSTAKPDDMASAYAKTSIRAIVKESTCHKVKAGTLYVFTCMGGTVGREGNHVAVLPEIRVSKRHATVSYCSDKYYITDEGTMNGTFLNGTRLSVQKEVSDRHELSHLDELKIGSTLLQLHIHTNQDTCNWCEPGLNNPAPVAATISEPPTLYKQRSKEVNRLKRKYKLMGSS